MPPQALKAARKAAARSQDVSRAEAANLSERTGLPYLHLGEERYGRLDQVLYLAGIDHTVTLSEDRRSPMRWPEYLLVVEAVLILAVTSDQDSFKAYGLTPLHRGADLIAPLVDLQPPEDAPPVIAATAELARDVRHAIPAYARPAPGYSEQVTGAMLRRLLELAATVCAALFLAEERDIDPKRLRQTVTAVLNSPKQVIDQINEINTSDTGELDSPPPA